MNSKQSILFLKEFTKQLVLNSRKPEKKIFFPAHPVKPVSMQIMHREIAPSTTIHQIPIQNIPRKVQPLQISQQTSTEIKTNPSLHINPSLEVLPRGFNIGKLEPLIQDPRVSTIECPGPGKFVLVKSLNKVSLTRITLNEEEIKNIIEIFSKQAKIPTLEGVFKAAVGNLVITAVISEFIGSRFIINKYNPYPILEGKNI